MGELPRKKPVELLCWTEVGRSFNPGRLCRVFCAWSKINPIWQRGRYLWRKMAESTMLFFQWLESAVDIFAWHRLRVVRRGRETDRDRWVSFSFFFFFPNACLERAACLWSFEAPSPFPCSSHKPAEIPGKSNISLKRYTNYNTNCLRGQTIEDENKSYTKAGIPMGQVAEKEGLGSVRILTYWIIKEHFTRSELFLDTVSKAVSNFFSPKPNIFRHILEMITMVQAYQTG